MLLNAHTTFFGNLVLINGIQQSTPLPKLYCDNSLPCFGSFHFNMYFVIYIKKCYPNDVNKLSFC